MNRAGLPPRLMETIRARLESDKRLALLSDCDGTLTGFQADPARVKLPPKIRESLERLRVIPGLRIAIISGRRVEDVRRLIGVEGIIYAGNHGLEIQGSDFDFVHPDAKKCRDDLLALRDELCDQLKRVPRVWIEDKHLTLSVHYRLVPSAEPEVKREVGDLLADFPTLRMVSGNMVVEIRPKIGWDKGKAVGWILERGKLPAARAVYLGDDTTDEDAFEFLRNGITIRVGPQRPTAAAFELKDPQEVETYLCRLVSLLENRRVRSNKPSKRRLPITG